MPIKYRHCMSGYIDHTIESAQDIVSNKNGNRMKKCVSVAAFTLAGIIFCFQTVSAEVRTWTSASGTTMEAEQQGRGSWMESRRNSFVEGRT